jgi:hypothetical protein
VSEFVSSEALNIGSTPGEHHIGISEDRPAISACLRRTTPLKLEISNNEAEFDEQMSFKVDQTL